MRKLLTPLFIANWCKMQLQRNVISHLTLKARWNFAKLGIILPRAITSINRNELILLSKFSARGTVASTAYGVTKSFTHSRSSPSTIANDTHADSPFCRGFCGTENIDFELLSKSHVYVMHLVNVPSINPFLSVRFVPCRKHVPMYSPNSDDNFSHRGRFHLPSPHSPLRFGNFAKVVPKFRP